MLSKQAVASLCGPSTSYLAASPHRHSSGRRTRCTPILTRPCIATFCVQNSSQIAAQPLTALPNTNSSSVQTAAQLAAQPYSAFPAIDAFSDDGDDSMFTRIPCSTPCDADDAKCLQLEALLQNVLKFPRIPPRVHMKYCEGHITADISSIRHLLVNLEAMLGRELTLHMIRRQPYILNQSFDVVKARHDDIQRWMGLRPSDMILLLKKNPSFLYMETELFKTNFTALKRLLPFTPDQFQALVRKYPIILNWRTEVIKRKLDYLRSLCSTREAWQGNLDYISPSLLAFFFRDSVDLTRRLEFLVVTGLSPKCQLRDVFKPSNNLFARKYKGFRAWKKRVQDDARINNTTPQPVL